MRRTVSSARVPLVRCWSARSFRRAPRPHPARYDGAVDDAGNGLFIVEHAGTAVQPDLVVTIADLGGAGRKIGF